VASDGVEAVEAVARQDYDLVLMAVQMPRMSGLEATRRIPDTVARPPIVVAVTAGALAEDRRACLEAGMDDYVAKPVRPPELKRVLHHYGTRIRTLAGSPSAARWHESWQESW
jgi:CheY-like chemotaxis protein